LKSLVSATVGFDNTFPPEKLPGNVARGWTDSGATGFLRWNERVSIVVNNMNNNVLRIKSSMAI